MKAIVVKSDDMVSVEEVDGYRDLVDYFDGLPEIVNPRLLSKPFCMIVDDMGLHRNLRINEFGSKLYGTKRHGNPIVGDIFVMKQVWGSDGYDLAGLTDNEIDSLVNKYCLNLGNVGSAADNKYRNAHKTS